MTSSGVSSGQRERRRTRRSGLCPECRRRDRAAVAALTGRPKAYTAFGELVVNRKLVPWWYRIHAGGRLVALSKEEVKEGEEPKARPIAVGMVDRRFWAKMLMARTSAAFARYLGPEQIAVGVSASAECIAFSMRTVLEDRTDFGKWSMDSANAFNAFVRALAGYALARAPAEIRRLLPYVCALMGPEAPLAAGLRFDDADAETGEEGSGEESGSGSGSDGGSDSEEEGVEWLARVLKEVVFGWADFASAGRARGPIGTGRWWPGSR